MVEAGQTVSQTLKAELAQEAVRGGACWYSFVLRTGVTVPNGHPLCIWVEIVAVSDVLLHKCVWTQHEDVAHATSRFATLFADRPLLADGGRMLTPPKYLPPRARQSQSLDVVPPSDCAPAVLTPRIAEDRRQREVIDAFRDMSVDRVRQWCEYRRYKVMRRSVTHDENGLSLVGCGKDTLQCSGVPCLARSSSLPCTAMPS